jgi:hypothetical protein
MQPDRAASPEVGLGLADAVEGVRKAILALGNGDACTDMGAIEAASGHLRGGLDGIAGELGTLAQAADGIADALSEIAAAIRGDAANDERHER